MDGKKKVLFIHHGRANGGAALSLLYTASGIKLHGFTPEIALIEPSEELHALYNTRGITTYELTQFPRYFYLSGDSFPKFSFLALKKILGVLVKYRQGKRKLKELLEEVQPDIVHLNSVVLVAGAQMLRQLKQPYVWHIREYGPSYEDFRLTYVRKEMVFSEKIIFLSEGERESWLGEGEKHGEVISNFIDLSHFDQVRSKTDALKVLGIKSTFTILYVGGFSPIKGPELLLETLKELKNKGTDFLCLMPGAISKKEIEQGITTEYESGLIRCIHDYGLSEHCLRLPFDSDVQKYYAAADVLIFPAKYPHFARPVIEASAMRVPVVVNDLKPLDELVVPGKTGYLSEPNGEEMAEKIILLMNDFELRKKIGLNGRQFASKKFDADKQIKKIIDYYLR